MHPTLHSRKYEQFALRTSRLGLAATTTRLRNLLFVLWEAEEESQKEIFLKSSTSHRTNKRFLNRVVVAANPSREVLACSGNLTGNWERERRHDPVRLSMVLTAREPAETAVLNIEVMQLYDSAVEVVRTCILIPETNGPVLHTHRASGYILRSDTEYECCCACAQRTHNGPRLRAQ